MEKYHLTLIYLSYLTNKAQNTVNIDLYFAQKSAGTLNVKSHLAINGSGTKNIKLHLEINDHFIKNVNLQLTSKTMIFDAIKAHTCYFNTHEYIIFVDVKIEYVYALQDIASLLLFKFV